QIRSELKDKDKFAVWGPQCDIAEGYWGSLYGEHFGGKKPGEGTMMKAAPKDVVAKVLKKDDFNDYYIKCVGKHVTIKLNGETPLAADFDNRPDEGIIAWQLHGGGPMEVTFKDIKFKEIKGKESVKGSKVEGRVTLDGKPLASGTVTFLPAEEKG